MLVADLEALRRHLNLERVALVGHSWGAGLAALYAIAHPDRVGRLVLVDAMPLRVQGLDVFSDTLMNRLSAEERAALDAARAARGKATTEAEQIDSCRAYSTVLGKAYYANPAAVARTHGDLCTPPGAGLANGRRVNGSVMRSLGEFDWRASVEAVRIPTLVIHGDRDPIPLDEAREWRKAIGTARLLVVQEAGHMSYVEQPDVVFPALETFLAGGWPAAAK
jgi:proline iminopeptidase